MTPSSCLGTCSRTLLTPWPTGPYRSTSANELSNSGCKPHPEGEGVLADRGQGVISGVIAKKPDRDPNSVDSASLRQRTLDADHARSTVGKVVRRWVGLCEAALITGKLPERSHIRG